MALTVVLLLTASIVVVMQDGLYERLYIVHETDALESGPSVTISVNGKPHSMTVQEISQMPLKQFAFLWTVSMLAQVCVPAFVAHNCSYVMPRPTDCTAFITATVSCRAFQLLPQLHVFGERGKHYNCIMLLRQLMCAYLGGSWLVCRVQSCSMLPTTRTCSIVQHWPDVIHRASCMQL